MPRSVLRAITEPPLPAEEALFGNPEGSADGMTFSFGLNEKKAQQIHVYPLDVLFRKPLEQRQAITDHSWSCCFKKK